MDIPPALLPDAEHQAWVVTTQQCLAATMTVAQIRRLVRIGSWRRLHRGVYVVHSGPLAPHSEIWAALLACGPDAIVSHGASLWMARPWQGHLPKPIDISIPEKRDVRDEPDGVRLHRLRRLVALPGDPPRMSPERAVLEMAHLESDAGKVVGLVTTTVGARITTASDIRDELAKRPRQRWRALLVAMLADVEAGAQSPFELRDLRNDRAHGLPWRERQVTTRVDGDNTFLDVCVTVPETGAKVVKELDGRLGHEGTGRFRDMRRDNASTLRGRSTLRLGWLDMEEVPCELAAAFYLLLARFGWTGTPTTCGPGCTFFTDLERLRLEYAA